MLKILRYNVYSKIEKLYFEDDYAYMNFACHIFNLLR